MLVPPKGWLNLVSHSLAAFLALGILSAWTSAPPPTPAAGMLTILKPGETSQVLSPIPVEAEITVGEIGALRLDLVGADGRVMSRKSYAFRACDEGATEEDSLLNIGEPASFCGKRSVHFSTSLVFGISEGNQPARLQMVLLDGEQRIVTLNSIGLTLITNGTPKIVSPSSSWQGISLALPEEGAPISGRELVISGEAPVTRILPMRIEVQTTAGKMLASRMVSAKHTAGRSEDPQTGAFRVDIPIKVKTEQQVIITVTASDEEIPGDRYITSRIVTLLP